MRRFPGTAAALVALVGLSLAAAGCAALSGDSIGPTYSWVDQIVPPSALVEPMRQVYRPGEDILVTVQVIAPKGRAVLDSYLPISGRFYVRRQDSPLGLEPLDDKLASVDLPPDERHRRTRSFTVNVARAFPMREPGWYLVSWAGESSDCQLLTVDVAVRVLPGAPEPKR